MADSTIYYRARSELKNIIRRFFIERSYCEVDTPIAVLTPGAEVHLNYFSSRWVDYQYNEYPFWLRSSPEIHMKQLLAQGFEKIFQLAVCFRNNGEYAKWHHPEFTMLEWYQTQIGYKQFIDLTEDLFYYAVEHFSVDGHFTGGRLLPQKFERITVTEAFAEFADIVLYDNDCDLAAKARSNGIHSVNATDDFETAFFKILIDRIEPGLKRLQASVLYDYPPSQASLAKIENGCAKRFEFYINGIELSNGFLELTNLQENKKRFNSVNEQRIQLNKEPIELDPNFIYALQRGIPDCCGNALGFDRLLALLLGHEGIDKVIPFRQMYIDVIDPIKLR
ncbi:MAG: EF-P lysine aminoacylase EpmA [Bdellovibrionota bacterium]